MKLIVKIATRSRPEKFKSVMEQYISYTSGDNDVRFIVTCDSDDETMNNPDMISWFEEKKKTADLSYYFGDSKTKVEACNANLENENADVLLLISDDMVPAAINYDSIIQEAFAGTFPAYDGAIKFNDGLRNDVLMTLPCLGWNLYQALGHIYHPDYTSLYCDNEQTRLCAMMEKLAVSDICIARHEWTPAFFNDGSVNEQADELHKRNESYYDEDGEVFKRRAQNNFDLEEVKAKLQLIMDPSIVFNQTNS